MENVGSNSRKTVVFWEGVSNHDFVLAGVLTLYLRGHRTRTKSKSLGKLEQRTCTSFSSRNLEAIYVMRREH
jgi:hypothetical protein